MEMDEEELFEKDEIVVNYKDLSAVLAACANSTIYKVTTVKLENDSQEPEPGCSSWSRSYVLQQETGSGFCQIFIKEEVQDSPETGECLEDQELTSVESRIAPISSEDANGSEVGELHPEKGNLTDFDKFTTMSIVENDLRNHQNPQVFSCKTPFSCEFCDYKCSYQSVLKRHLRRHTGEKPFSCEFCDYKCYDASSLKTHLRIHTGEKPFSCEFCDYKCSRSFSLKSHLQTHTREKPFSCEFCVYKCSWSSSLKLHLKTHTGEKPFSCEFCDYKCSRSFSLKSHLQTHTREKPFSCEFCVYKCSWSSSLKLHLKTHTGEKP